MYFVVEGVVVERCRSTHASANLVAEERQIALECESYEAAANFDGARDGCVFKLGPAGLGYYRDLKVFGAGPSGSE